MKAMTPGKTSSCGKDLAFLAGSGTLLSICLLALALAVHYWFVRCASVPMDWVALLGGRG